MSKMSGFLPTDLIKEVRIRPGIYNKAELVPPRREQRQKLWLEVAKSLIPPEEWANYTNAEKEIRVGEIANKWKNLRDHFHREIKLLEAGLTNKKRRYIYFDEMEFVRPYIGYKLPPIKKREKNSLGLRNSTRKFRSIDTDTEMDEIQNSGDDATDDDSKVAVNNNKAKQLRSKTMPVIKHTRKTKQNKPSSNTSVGHRLQEEVIIKNFDVLKKIDSDQNPTFKIRESDISFCLSLVPTLRQLSDDRKLSAKIDILKVLRKNLYNIDGHSDQESNGRKNHKNNTNKIIEKEEIEDDSEDGENVKRDPLNGNDNTKTWWT